MDREAKNFEELLTAYDEARVAMMERAREDERARQADPEPGTYEARERLRPLATALKQSVGAFLEAWADLYQTKSESVP